LELQPGKVEQNSAELNEVEGNGTAVSSKSPFKLQEIHSIITHQKLRHLLINHYFEAKHKSYAIFQ
jgi:hypothetical protein